MNPVWTGDVAQQTAGQRASAARTRYSLLATRYSLLIHGLAACAGIGFAVTAVLRHRAFHSAANDLAFFDQIIWNTAHGRPFATSFVPYNFLGQHVQPVLALYALLYHLWPSPELLLITQSLLVAAAAIPLFHIARRLLHADLPAALVAGAYLASPYLHHAAHFDFHPETMAPFFVFLGYRFVLDGRRRAAVCALLPLLLLKEDTAVLLIGVAWLCWLRRERRLAATLVGIAVTWGAFATLIVMPHFRSGPSDLEERYGYLGNGAAGILTGLVTHPQRALAHLLTWGVALALLGFIGSAGFLPLAAPAEALAMLPLLAFHLLSTHVAQMHLRLHYSAEVLPLLWIAAVCGLANVAAWAIPRAIGRNIPAMMTLSRGWLVLAACIAFVTASPFSPMRGFGSAEYHTDAAHRDAIAEAIAHIPPDAVVSAQTGLAPHLSHRETLFEFPEGVGAPYILLDARGDIARFYQSRYAPAVTALPNEGYTPVWSRDGVTLYRRGD